MMNQQTTVIKLKVPRISFIGNYIFLQLDRYYFKLTITLIPEPPDSEYQLWNAEYESSVDTGIDDEDFEDFYANYYPPEYNSPPDYYDGPVYESVSYQDGSDLPENQIPQQGK